METKNRTPRGRGRGGMRMDKDGWPEHLLVPEEEDFAYGAWVDLGVAAQIVVDTAIENGFDFSKAQDKGYAYARDHECGTQCCLVGWMGLAFDGPTRPGFLEKNFRMSKAHKTFAETFFEVATGTKAPRVTGSWHLQRLSNLFEGELGLSPSDACKLWLETAKRCGYDVDHLTRNWKEDDNG